VHSEERTQCVQRRNLGTIFIYQGFNDYCGWMHTSSNVDVADMYAEKIRVKKTNFYEYESKLLPVTEKTSP
jgi:acyl-homoserine lactone acylase PvdQ